MWKEQLALNEEDLDLGDDTFLGDLIFLLLTLVCWCWSTESSMITAREGRQWERWGLPRGEEASAATWWLSESEGGAADDGVLWGR